MGNRTRENSLNENPGSAGCETPENNNEGENPSGGKEENKESEGLSDLLKVLLRVSQAQACPAKAPDKFSEGPRANIASWLEAMENYLKAKRVPKPEYVENVLTFFAESVLAKIKRAHLGENSQSYKDFKKNLISILGKPEDAELARKQLDSARQFPSENVADFSSRILELVSKAWGGTTPRYVDGTRYPSFRQWVSRPTKQRRAQATAVVV